MDAFPEKSRTEDLTAAAADVASLSGQPADSQTLDSEVKERLDVSVKGSDIKHRDVNSEMPSGDGSVVVETEVVSLSVEEKVDDQEMNGIGGGKEAENGIVSGEEKLEDREMDGFGGRKEAGNGTDYFEEVEKMEEHDVQENRVQDCLEDAKEVVDEIESNSRATRMVRNGVHDGREQDVIPTDEASGSSDEEDVGEKDHEFSVGDFVWGKIRSYPWWPGQIYDPSDASDFAVKRKTKNRLLVAYFGDGSFSWCSPSQLKRFAENFDDMSKQSNSKNFLNAVEKALDEFSRLVEMEMSCKCVPLKNQMGNVMPINSGLKAGVSVPRGKNMKFFLAQLKPEGLLENLKGAAKMVSMTSTLELVILRSWLAAFYRRKGGYMLPQYHYPLPVEGLEDMMGTVINRIGPPEEDWTSNQSVLSPEISGDKVYQRRMQKSVAELMEEDFELKRSKASLTKFMSAKKRSKDNNEADNGGNTLASNTSRKRGRKRRADIAASPEQFENGAIVDEAKKERENQIDEVDDETTIKSFASRERKRSKYLSPPYTKPKGSGRMSGSSKDAETDSETNVKMGVRMAKVAGQLISSTPTSTSSRYQLEQKHAKVVVDGSLNVNEVLNVILAAAVDPFYMWEKKVVDEIAGFISAFRSSVFSNGSNYESYQGQPDKKGKQLQSEAGNEESGSPIFLILTFPPAFTLPSKDDLIKLFAKFGEINELETDVFFNSFCARLAFVRSSDAEEAYNVSVEKSPFGDANVNYRLRYPAVGQKVSSACKKSAMDVVSYQHSVENSTGLGLIMQKLEAMTSMVKSWEGQIKSGMKADLEVELKDLLEKVGALA